MNIFILNWGVNYHNVVAVSVDTDLFPSLGFKGSVCSLTYYEPNPGYEEM